jgi:hypothetical protein
LEKGSCEKIGKYLLSLDGRGEGEGGKIKSSKKLFIPLPLIPSRKGRGIIFYPHFFTPSGGGRGI